jgi:hypothetical protein
MLEPRVQEDTDSEGIKEIPSISFDITKRDWIEEKKKVDAEIV